jgi:hypothetical protein
MNPPHLFLLSGLHLQRRELLSRMSPVFFETCIFVP